MKDKKRKTIALVDDGRLTNVIAIAEALGVSAKPLDLKNKNNRITKFQNSSR